MAKVFKFLPVAENKSSVSVYAVCRKTHQVLDQGCSGFQLHAEVGGAIAQQEAMDDHSRNSGDCQ